MKGSIALAVLMASSASLAFAQNQQSVEDAQVYGLNISHLPKLQYKRAQLTLEARGIKIDPDLSIQNNDTITLSRDDAASTIDALLRNKAIQPENVDDILILPDDGHQTFYRKRNDVEQVAGPKQTIDNINLIREKKSTECRAQIDTNLKNKCLTAVDLKYTQLSLSTLRFGNSDLGDKCNLAAKAYAKASRDSLRAAEQDADVSCFNTPWGYRADVSATFAKTIETALAATAIIEFNGVPFCSGVFLSGTRVLTAKHCFQDGAILRNFGKITIAQPAHPEIMPLRINASVAVSTDILNVDRISVADDVIELTTLTPAQTPPLTFSKIDDATEAVTIGFMPSISAISHTPLSDGQWAILPEWYKHVRISKQGGCYAMDSKDNCFRMSCTTVGGFSGAPVFSSELDEQGRLKFFGLNIAPETDDRRCGSPMLALGTIGHVVHS